MITELSARILLENIWPLELAIRYLQSVTDKESCALFEQYTVKMSKLVQIDRVF